MKLNVYSAKGVKKTATDLPKNMEEKENALLLAQAIRVYEDRKHPGLSKVKTRGEIDASTRKIYRQKGTGNARHGDVGAPIFVGGGKAHGPKGIKRTLSLPKKMRQKALNIALSQKAKDGQILVIDGFSTFKKTKEVADLLQKVVKAEKNITEKSRFTFVLSSKNSEAERVIRNIKNTTIVRFLDLNAYSVYFGGIIIIDKEALNPAKETKSTETKKTK